MFKKMIIKNKGIKINAILLIKIIIILFLLISNNSFSQYNLNYFLDQAYKNSPVINDFTNQRKINDLQSKLNEAQNSSFHVFLGSDVLFAPYFNNSGSIISAYPEPDAIGYDVGITNGGLYSAQVNAEKNIFNSHILKTFDEQNAITGESIKNNNELERHNLEKAVTDQYFTTLGNLLAYKLSSETEANISRQLTIAESMVKSGYMQSQDYLLLKIELKSQKSNSDEIKQNYVSGLINLYALCGISDTNIVNIDSIGLAPVTENQNSKFLTPFKFDSLNLNIQQKLFETKYDPQLKIFANAGLNAIEFQNIERKFGFSAGLNLTLPIFDGDQRSITGQQTEIGIKTVQNYRNFREQNIAAMRHDAAIRMKSTERKIADLKSQIEDYQIILDNTANKLKSGNISMIDYLTLFRSFIEFKKNLIASEINYQLELSNYNYWNW